MTKNFNRSDYMYTHYNISLYTPTNTAHMHNTLVKLKTFAQSSKTKQTVQRSTNIWTVLIVTIHM